MKQQTDTFLNCSIQNCLKHLFLNKFIHLKAICKKKNMKRFYTIHIHKNLFQEITVSLYYGRIGSHAQTKHYYFQHDNEAHQFLRYMLRKRLNAKKRIGVNYQLG